jgi:hypothetical protein
MAKTKARLVASWSASEAAWALLLLLLLLLAAW